MKASTSIKGLATWTKTRILGTNDFSYSVSLYDDNGRIVQVQTKNHTGGIDVATTQYDFSGKVLRTHLSQQQGSSAPLLMATKMKYDAAGRIVALEKKVGNSTDWKPLTTMTYDELGQLKNKKLAPTHNSGDGLETLVYEYNIRGWLLGMNRAYLEAPGSTAAKFGFELAYDKTTSKGYQNNYAAALYNGNITGMLWKSTGDKEARRYNFTYDNVNRLLKADFHQQAGTTWANDKVNFTMQVGDGENATSAYDANGNIRAMKQWGLKLTGSDVIDDFSYSYKMGDLSNKLGSVTESSAIADIDYKLGDFTDKNRIGDDYDYDVNGNLTLDHNKKISSIAYNHLNLPQVVTVKKDDGSQKGTITYHYDAGGNKLKKVTLETGAAVQKDGQSYTTDITTTTTYLNGVVYESKAYSHSALASLAITDKLQFLPHEEGRTRLVTLNEQTTPVYDYFIKDHLGNVRLVLTEEVTPPAIYQATMEAARRSTEVALFSGIPDTEAAKPDGFDAEGSGNQTVSRLAGTTAATDKRVGPAIVLKVMAGDKIKANVFSWYKPSVTDAGTESGLPSLVSTLVDAFTGNVASKLYWETPEALKNSGKVDNALNQFLQTTPVSNTQAADVPKAYLNWMVLDEEQFKVVDGNYGATQISKMEVGEQKKVIQAGGGGEITIQKNGYLYVYLSNESRGSVYFDQLHVEHQRGELLEETHYYPFGLTMHGISSKSAGGLENKFKFNEGAELNADLNLNFYETPFRSFDPQLGRFHQIDAMAEDYDLWSPYNFSLNNPIAFNDPTGLNPECKDCPDKKDLSEVVVKASPKNRWNLTHWFEFADLHKKFDQIDLQKHLLNQGVNERGLRLFNLAWESRGYRERKAELDQAAWEMEEQIAKEAALWFSGGRLLSWGGKLVSWGYRTIKANQALNATRTARVFWSGGNTAKNAAETFAKANGMKTLEMTMGGRIMNALNPIVPRSISNPIWNRLSANFANGASGSVNVFHNATDGVRLTSVWRTIEYPILKNNNVNIIYNNAFR